MQAKDSVLFINEHHKVSFLYDFIFDRIVGVLVTFQERGHFVMIIKVHACHKPAFLDVSRSVSPLPNSLSLSSPSPSPFFNRGQTHEHAQCTRTQSPAAKISRAEILLKPLQNRCYAEKIERQ